MSLSWQKRRSELNHDWLKNRYMPALAKFLNLLDDKVEDVNFEEAFVSSILPEWESHRGEVRLVLGEFENEMSPRALFRRPPLSECDEHSKRWLGELIHSLWLTKYPVRKWVGEAASTYEKADRAYGLILSGLERCPDTRSVRALRRFRPLFEEFRRACQELASAMEKFPCEVKIA